MIAYLFPGQGSQFAGMGQELARQSALAGEVLQVVDGAVGRPLSEVMFGADAEALKPTQVQQPAIFAHSVAALAALRERCPAAPSFVAGHSLGEYAALVAAGALELAEAARLVALRGEMMAAAGREVGGGMAAVIGLEPEAVQELVREAASDGVLVVANYNCPGQTVISGEDAPLARAVDLARERGGRAVPLKVSGAFHSPLMTPVQERLRPHLEAAGFRDAAVPVVSNVDATPRTDAPGLRHAAISQVTGSVRWEDSVRRMIAAGVDAFVEIGPGSVLCKLIQRIDPAVPAYPAGDMGDIDAFAQALGA
jgi:[acyl-carrier-protein] S-malonyltransferase